MADSELYRRIKLLCAERGMTIALLESELGFSKASISKWNSSVSPSIDRIVKVATYFNVSIDYLLGKTDYRSTISDILGDEDIITFQRAKQKMSDSDKQRMMQMLKLAFYDVFGD